MKTFNIGDTVYRGIDPEYTISGEFSIKCTIAGIRKEIRAGVKPVVITYEIEHETFDSPEYLSPDVLFETEEEAKISVVAGLGEKIKRLRERLTRYEAILADDR